MKNKKVIKEKLLKQLEEWMDWLEIPNENFGGYPVCPFLAPERKQNKLLIEFYDPEEGLSLFELIRKFDQDDRFTTAMYLHMVYSNNYNFLVFV